MAATTGSAARAPDRPAPVQRKRKLSRRERVEEKKRLKRVARTSAGGGRPTNTQEFDKAVAKAMSDPKQGRISFITQIDQSQGKRKAHFVQKMGVSNLQGKIVRAAGEVFADCDSNCDSGSGSDGGGGEGDRSGSGSSEPDSDVEMAEPVASPGPVAPPALDPPTATAASAAGDAIPDSSGDDPDDGDFDPLEDALSSSSGEDLALQSVRRELVKKAKEQSTDFQEAIADLLRAEDDFVHDRKRKYTQYEESERQFCLKALYAMGTGTKGKWKFTAAANLMKMVGAHFSNVNKGLLSLWHTNAARSGPPPLGRPLAPDAFQLLGYSKLLFVVVTDGTIGKSKEEAVLAARSRLTRGSLAVIANICYTYDDVRGVCSKNYSACKHNRTCGSCLTRILLAGRRGDLSTPTRRHANGKTTSWHG